jgi:hypothetical protein
MSLDQGTRHIEEDSGRDDERSIPTGRDKPDQTTRVELSTGTVEARTQGAWSLDDLCGFAARNNARRGFLVVSKVLGRHVPVKPSVMRRSFQDLAAMLDPDLKGPVLFVGMAETATCLGQGVHEEYLEMTGRTDVATMHSSRQVMPGEVMLTFVEPHSHASDHLLYMPEDEDVLDVVMNARTVVLVDDESSTGTTFVNLANALIGRIPSIERIETVVLADWTGERKYLDDMPVPAGATSLLRGTLRWIPREGVVKETVHPPRGAMGRLEGDGGFGRKGRLDVAQETDALADVVHEAEPTRYLVLGTGEFTYPPFRIAEELERRGHDVVVQATTRSPVHVGGAIGCAMTFSDNYGTGVANYLYNQRKEEGRRVVVCHETPDGSVCADLLDGLGGRTVNLRKSH